MALNWTLDLSLVMASFDFEADVERAPCVHHATAPTFLWRRLLHIVQSKHAVGRDKDRLFLATHREALQELLERENRREP